MRAEGHRRNPTSKIAQSENSLLGDVSSEFRNFLKVFRIPVGAVGESLATQKPLVSEKEQERLNRQAEAALRQDYKTNALLNRIAKKKVARGQSSFEIFCVSTCRSRRHWRGKTN